MNVSIRTATTDDSEVIANLSSQLGYTIFVEDTKLNIELVNKSTNDILYVTVLNNHVVGWMRVFYSFRIESKPFCEIAGVVVDESSRGIGVGKMLIDKAIEWSLQKNAETLRVRTNVTRTKTHKFYEKMEFTLKKEQKVYVM